MIKNEILLYPYYQEAWSSLPLDIRREILRKLSIVDLLQMTRTSKDTKRVIDEDNFIWNTLLNRRAGDNEIKELDSAKNTYINLYNQAHHWTCYFCGGYPIDGIAYLCWNCDNFACCDLCYKKFGHFENHLLTKYYRRMKAEDSVIYNLCDPVDEQTQIQNCFKCKTQLILPLNRSVTDPTKYYCDACVGYTEADDGPSMPVKRSDDQIICRVVHLKEVPLEEVDTSEEVTKGCSICHKSWQSVYGSDTWPYFCTTCHFLNFWGHHTICRACFGSPQMMSEHPGHEIVLTAKPNNHLCSCDCCESNMRYGVRYRCAVCYDYDLCEYCEPSNRAHCKGTHPMMIIHQQVVRNMLYRGNC